MGIIDVFRNQHVDCPLCQKRMREVVTNKGTFFACFTQTCMININKKDPALNRWNENLKENPVCPQCGTNMRMFFRAADKFMVCQCPKCTKEGRLVEVRKGKVEDLNPNSNWNYNPGVDE